MKVKRGAGSGDCDALFSASRLEEDLRDCGCTALYFNFFVFVVQSFEKVLPLKATAPTQKEPPFALAQIVLLLLFVVLTTFAVKRFRTAQ